MTDNYGQIKPQFLKILDENYLEKVQETAKYYERAIRTGVLTEKQVNLVQLKPGLKSGKSVEELRKAAMKIKEAKNIATTKKVMREYFDIPAKKTLTDAEYTKLSNDFLNDLNTGFEAVKKKVAEGKE